MGLNYNVVQGNFHQNNHHLFGEHSAGRQCTCNGLCALALNEIFPCCFWAADDLDTLLYAGNALYSHITRAVDEPGYLLLSELPDEFRFQDSLFRAHFGDSCYGLVNENCEGFPDLGVSLNNIFAQHTTCLLTVNFYTITLLKDVSLSQFFVFDSHSRNHKGLFTPEGTATLVQCNSVEQLHRYLLELLSSLNLLNMQQFELSPVLVKKVAQSLLDCNTPNAETDATLVTMSLQSPTDIVDNVDTCKSVAPVSMQGPLDIVDDRDEFSSDVECNLDTTDDYVKIFRASLVQGPDYICTCCWRRLYKSNVRTFPGRDAYSKMNESDYEYSTSEISAQDKEWICLTCHSSLKKGKLPAQAHANALQLDDIPPELNSLCNLEVRLISQRIPFMKIVSLPRGGVPGIKGPVVNVPADLSKVCALLPRTPTNMELVPLKFKRKLSYDRHVFHETIRPHAVEAGLKYLIEENPMYAGVSINYDWQSEFENEPEVCDIFTGICTNQNAHDEIGQGDLLNSLDSRNTDRHDDERGQGDQSNNLDDMNINSDTDEPEESPAVCLDTCLQPEEISPDLERYTINLAPGEGQRPLSLFQDEDCEVFSFPKFFPKGRFGFNTERPSKLHLRKYFNSRLLCKDTRFSESSEYLFFSQYMTEAQQIQQNISISFKKTKTSGPAGIPFTAGMVRSDSVVNSLEIKE